MSNITLSQVANLQDDSWVNGSLRFAVTITEQKTSRSGQPFWSAILTDPDDPGCPEVDTAFFSDPSRYHGKVCELGGKGTKKGSYNGRPKLNIGKTAFLKILNGNVPFDGQPVGQSNGHRQPPLPSNRQFPQTTPPRTGAGQINGTQVNGQSIGMAVKEACTRIQVTNADFTEDNIVAIAGVVLRASDRLTQGEHLRPAQTPQNRPRPGPGGSVALDNGPEEDYPFNQA